MGDAKIKEIITSVVIGNRETVSALLERMTEGNHSLEQFKEVFFSNLKPKIIDELAGQMGMQAASIRDRWEKVTAVYPLDKLQSITDEIAEEKWKIIGKEQ